MIMEDFVPSDLLDKLKEKGFPIKTKTEGKFGLTEVKKVDILPTISQVLKWLREEKLILIGLSPMQEYDGDEIVEWCATVYKADKQGGLSWQEELYYQSYEEAAFAGIKYILDNLI